MEGNGRICNDERHWWKVMEESGTRHWWKVIEGSDMKHWWKVMEEFGTRHWWKVMKGSATTRGIRERRICYDEWEVGQDLLRRIVIRGREGRL